MYNFLITFKVKLTFVSNQVTKKPPLELTSGGFVKLQTNSNGVELEAEGVVP